MFLITLLSCLLVKGSLTNPVGNDEVSDQDLKGILENAVPAVSVKLGSLPDDDAPELSQSDYLEKPYRSCPEGSKISSKDMYNFIQHFMDEDKFVEELNNSYYPSVDAVLHTYQTNYTMMTLRLEAFPEHLKEIIGVLDNKQQDISKIVSKLSAVLAKYPEFKQQYDSKVNKFQYLTNETVKVLQICHLNCDKNEPTTTTTTTTTTPNPTTPEHYRMKRSAVSDFALDYQCISLKQLKANVKGYIQSAKINARTFLDGFTQELSIYYSNKFLSLAKSIKELVLEELGETMLDALTLQDAYIHIERALRDNKDFNLDTLKQTLAKFDIKVIDLAADLEQLRKNCLNCRGKRIINARSGKMVLRAENDKLDKYIFGQVVNEVLYNLTESYTLMFKPVDAEIDKNTEHGALLKKLKGLEQVIKNMIQQNQEKLNALMNQIDVKTLCEFSGLFNSTNTLIENVDTLDATIKSNKHY